MTKPEGFGKRLVIVLGLLIVFVLVTISLSAATLGTMIRRFDRLEPKEKIFNFKSKLSETVKIDDLMVHLRQLQRIADESNSTRAIDTIGFNKTIDYIVNFLRKEIPEFEIYREEFSVRRFALREDPIFISKVDGLETKHNFSSNVYRSDFAIVIYSNSTDFSDFLPIEIVKNVGCNRADWNETAGKVALVHPGGSCTNSEKGILAGKSQAKALLFYNSGTSAATLPPSSIRIRLANKLPALFLSHALGQYLVQQKLTKEVSVKIKILLNETLGSFPVENICADTPNPDKTQIIVVGSHTDSVPAGPGINDNGSGTSANLVLATNLAKLYRSSTENNFLYRVRFCWWAAEEIGLAGSSYHVEKAKTSTEVGHRLQDYLINLNFDMAASPNYIFGIYDAKTAPSETPRAALPGSQRVTDLYRDWLMEQNLPYDFRDFNGRSDYGPFLAAGIVAGGVATGADAVKTENQREKYRQLVGEENSGLTGAILDPCYHLLCDNINNIQQFAFEKIVQTGAFGLEFLGRKSNLSDWLYPSGRNENFD